MLTSTGTIFNVAAGARTTKVCGLGEYNVSEETTLEDLLLGPRLRASEITYPPYAFLMALTTEGIDPRLFDISFFADFDYDE